MERFASGRCTYREAAQTSRQSPYQEQNLAMNYIKRSALALVFTAISIALEGCDMKDSQQDVSRDISGLSKVINLNIPASFAQWEIFGTPEYKGGVPGPTDFVTLIAELHAVPKDWINLNSAAEEPIYIVPEAARPWLSPAFRTFLDEKKNSNADMAAHPECRRYLTSMKKTGQKVDGFVCAQADNILLYITLSSPQ
jgi:hypothetical protein